MNEERDSQLSAMFDGELPAAECELLARRLTRDDALRSQWSRYALIGAALRAERGVKLHDRVAKRVQSALAQEPTYGDAADSGATRPAAASAAGAAKGATSRWMRFARPAAAAGIAASVAAVSIVYLRGQGEPADTMLAATVAAPQTITLTPEPATLTQAASPAPITSRTGEPERYSTPAPSSQTSIVPPARLANYVVAHSEYSGPLSRRMALLSLVGDQGEVAVPAEGADAADGSGAPDAP